MKLKPGTLVRIKETPPLTYQGYSNKIGIIVKTTKEHITDPVIMHIVLIEEKLASFSNNELDRLEEE